MDQSELTTRLSEEINNCRYNLKAEALLSQAFKEGLLDDNFSVSFNGFFYREYRKDILSTELKKDYKERLKLHLDLSRGGVYDHLPEGLFFQPGQYGKDASHAGEMAEEYRLNKAKEKEVRQFFQPLETEFFSHRLQIEIEECRMIGELQTGLLTDYLLQFWRLPPTIGKRFVRPLMLLLPYAHKIVSNPSLTAQSLQLLLKEYVQLRRVDAEVSTVGPLVSQTLGRASVGVDLVCGQEFIEDYPLLECTIGPLEHSRIEDYLEEGVCYTLLKAFQQFFFPACADVIYRIEVPRNEMHMNIEAGAEPVLGYSSLL